MPTKNGRKKGPARRPSKTRPATSKAAILRIHKQMGAHFRALDRKRTPAVSLRAAEPAALSTVTFTCSNFPAVLVTISTHAGAALLQPEGTFRLTPGDHNIVWSAQGSTGASFDVSVTNGTLDQSISGPLPAGGDGGPRVLTVT
jgi:hypothetical protein